MNEAKPVVIYNAASEPEAQIVRGKLQSSGIPALIQYEGLAPAMMGYASGAYKILVPDGWEREARAVLESPPGWTAEP